jgi:hypothetical protein
VHGKEEEEREHLEFLLFSFQGERLLTNLALLLG